MINDFELLEKDLSDANYKKKLQEQIDHLINKHFRNISDVEQNEFELNSNTEAPDWRPSIQY